ncbi:MAG TPA: septum formation initiator family protein [Candidatus Hungatella pullicola]|nr:septum formation initiator family protein [Candidatus Hungatella pullicola]
MAAKRNMGPYRETSYVQGNTVRKLEPARRSGRESMDAKQRVSANHRVRRNQEKALQMDLPYVIMLTFAAVCTLYLCVSYLQLQSSITTRMRNIETLEAQLETLKAKNDDLETSINTSIDLDHIYQVATQELGMVYANKDQILQYDKTESEYVRQNEEIPKY